MSQRFPLLIRWLTFAALADWLITRTLTRVGIFIPKSPPIIAVYQAVNITGQVASSLAGLLALAALLVISWHQMLAHRQVWLPLILGSLAALSIVSLFVPPTGWSAVEIHLLTIIALSIIIWRLERRRFALVLFPVLALFMSELYKSAPALYDAMHWPGPAPLSNLLFGLGELFVVMSGFAWWWFFGRKAARRVWLWASLPALIFSGMFLATPAMTGILTIWSIGLTLYLPWPLYAFSLWLTGVALLETFRQDTISFQAILLFMAGGFAPQLSTQVFFGLVALWLLTVRTKESIAPRQKISGEASLYSEVSIG